MSGFSKVVILIGVIAAVLWAFNIGTFMPRAVVNINGVYAVCRYYESHVTSVQAKDACGLAQSSTGTEYICNQFDACVVEVK